MRLSIKSLLLTLVVAAVGVMMVNATDNKQEAGVSGTVDSVVTIGTDVKEGDVLVSVETLAGPVPAVRATTEGKVIELNVHPGDVIEQGQVVAVISSK